MVEITVHYSPGAFVWTQNPSVWVRVTDKVNGVPQTVGELLLFLPAAGGSTSARILFPMPADASFTPDFTNEITVTVDPDNQIAERNENNNNATVLGTCIG